MDGGYETELERLLGGVAAGTVEVDAAVESLRRLPFSDLGFARVDHHRSLRQGVIEFVYAPGKTREQILAIVAAQLDREETSVVVTRVEPEDAAAVAELAEGRGLAVTRRDRSRLVAIPRVVPEPRGRLEEDLGMRLRVGDVVAVHARVERVRHGNLRENLARVLARRRHGQLDWSQRSLRHRLWQ